MQSNLSVQQMIEQAVLQNKISSPWNPASHDGPVACKVLYVLCGIYLTNSRQSFLNLMLITCFNFCLFGDNMLQISSAAFPLQHIIESLLGMPRYRDSSEPKALQKQVLLVFFLCFLAWTSEQPRNYLKTKLLLSLEHSP